MSEPIGDARPRCNACNKVLKDLISIARGFGPTCWKWELLAAGQEKKPKVRTGKGEVVTDPRQLTLPFPVVVQL